MNWLREHKDQVRSALIGLIVIGIAAFGASGVYLYRQRLATEAEIADRYIETSKPDAHVQTEDLRAEAQEKEALAKEFRLDTDEIVWDGKVYKRNSYMKAILCVGVDRSDAMTEEKQLGEAGQADGVFLLAQDTARNELKVLMIPRDTITEITYLNPDGTVKGKELEHLSLAFAHGDGMHESCKNITEATSELLYGLKIDHYFAADMEAIGLLNDAVGGVTVTVPMFGMEHAGEAFKPGEKITLKGDLAERFVRYRDTNTDHSAIYRMNQQKEYLTQYFAALQEASKTDSRIIETLFGLIEDHMVTDMTKDQYMKLALDTVTGSGFGNDGFRMVAGNSVITELFDEFYVNHTDTIPVILELFYREVQ